jgi:hypothetical protein
MSDEEFAAIIGDAKEQLTNARACLDLFEKDFGWRAATTAEVHEWAGAQDRERLQFRIKRRLRADEEWTTACKRIWKDVPAPLISRPPLGQRIFCSLGEAAKSTALSESTILIAIEEGRITGIKDMFGEWHIDRAQLDRISPPLQGDVPSTISRRCKAIDASALVLEVEIATVIRQAAETLRQRRPWWRRFIG